jgi:hypothetical protein
MKHKNTITLRCNAAPTPETLHTPATALFVVPAAVSAVCGSSIRGTVRGGGHSGEPWFMTEALAQFVALHTRWLCGFSCHAFLLSVRRMPHIRLSAADLPAGATAPVHALLTSRTGSDSRHAFEYTVQMQLGARTVQGILLTGTLPYDGRFSADRLQKRYRELFAWLTRH